MCLTAAPAPPPPVDVSLAIHVLAGRGLKAMDSNGLSDPYVTFELGKGGNKNQKCKTKVVPKSLNPCFDEHFDLQGSSADQLTVQVWDKDFIGAGDLIGQCTISLGSLTANPQSQILEKLVDSTRFNTLSVSSPTSSAPQWYEIWDKEGVHTGDISLSLRVTPTAESGLLTQEEAEAVTLTISQLAGRALKAMDSSLFGAGTSDPYITFNVATGDIEDKATRMQTKVIKKNCNPEWRDQTLQLQVSLADIAGGDLHVRVFDKDLVGSDDLIGEVRVTLSAVSAQEFVFPRWLPILDESQEGKNGRDPAAAHAPGTATATAVCR